MVKEKETNHYELLLVVNEKKKNENTYKKMIHELSSQVKIEKTEEKEWKTAYQIKQTTSISYVVVTFFAPPLTIPDLVNKILKPYPKEFLNRYLLINLDREKSKSIPEPKAKKELKG
ncbi:MAG: hypothetical protein I3273_00145 [Candidatus Moeniiplasma glomeromycotorum]|nr:hypothetical protein [Candidatus Moeniiplasma glomeromycotorum]MCE8167460.1 hypothetical protein [Candidatus Moeniiplasma glomeromycotorum]MCE8168526.1 hypothetical protein [Candidatus Moeniiplasma glomeromycotorum]